MLLKSTTRHIRIFAAEIVQGELEPSTDKFTLDVDPDNELNWTDEALQSVYRKFEELVAAAGGSDLTEYNMRRIGSDLEHFVRSLLQSGQLSYNLKSRVRNYSLGLPQVVAEDA
jgi:NAD(P)H-quinone oxidoreductase subunit M